jgi:hypothetical protein
MRRALGRTLKSVLVHAALMVVVPFLVLEGTFRLLPVSHPPYLLPVSERTPVTHFQPNVEYRYSAGWNFALQSRKRTNNFGYVNAADYDPGATTPLLMVIGDSFVEAHEVDAGKSAAEVLHARLLGKGRVYSVGLSGSALSQYLAFAQYTRETFRPQAMAFVVIGNDFDESLLKYKSDPRLHYFDEHGGLRRVDYELSTSRKLLRHSAFVRYVMFNLIADRRIEQLMLSLRRKPEQETYMDATPQARWRRLPGSKRAVDYFFEQLPARAGLDSRSILFVLDGMRPALYSAEALAEAEKDTQGFMRRYFTAQARSRGYEVIDMQPAFLDRHRRDGSRFEFPSDNHWNELGQQLVADAIQGSAVFVRTFAGDAAAGP